MNTVIILIDEPLDRDKRILFQLKKYKDYNILDCSIVKPLKFLFIINIYFLFKVFFLSPLYWYILYKKYSLKPNGIFNGLKSSIFNYYKSEKIFTKNKNNFHLKKFKFIHANDLLCGMVGKKLSSYLNVDLVYDAHEIEFHRNRKNGLLRVVYDILKEKEVIASAKEVIVVNKPIKKIYMDIYNILESKITIVDNNHFTPYIDYGLKSFSNKHFEVAIVYVGGGINGRKLESLAKDTLQFSINVYAFFISNIPNVAVINKWKIGSPNYLPELLSLVQKKRLSMWCCTEDICLSYRLSLPNKFFQAMALGIPVIASKGTYLSEIVEKYDLGYIYNDNNFLEIVNEIKNSNRYYLLLKSISKFQQKLFIEKLEL